MPYDLNVDPNDPDADRKRRLWQLMQASINQTPQKPSVNNPVGFAGGTLQGQIARDQQPRGPAVATPVDMSAPPPHPPTAPAVNIPANASLAAPGMNPSALPNPSAPEAGGFPAPPTSEQPAGRPGFAVGSSLGGLLGSERTSKILEAMRTADPESKVSTEGGNLEVGPPHMGGYGFKGRLKAAGKGLLLGLATGDPNAPQSAGVGRALGGLITGAVSPRTEAKVQRSYDIHKQEQDLARQLSLEQGQAQVGDIQAQRRLREMQPEIEMVKADQQVKIGNARLEIERQKTAGLITKEQADIEQRKLDRKSREDIAAKNVISREKVANIRGVGGKVDNDALDENIRAAQEQQGKIDEGLKKQEAYLQTLSPTQPSGRYGDPAPNPVYVEAKKDYDKALAERNKLDEQIRGYRAKKKTPQQQGAAPTGDGKHHYSMAQIQATIDPKTGLTKNGKRLEQVLNELQSHPGVVVDQ